MEETKTELQLIKLSEIQSQEVSWLWFPFIVTRHFIVDEKSILFSTVSTPLRHLHFADRTLLSTKLCSQIKIFRLELCVQ